MAVITLIALLTFIHTICCNWVHFQRKPVTMNGNRIKRACLCVHSGRPWFVHVGCDDTNNNTDNLSPCLQAEESLTSSKLVWMCCVNSLRMQYAGSSVCAPGKISNRWPYTVTHTDTVWPRSHLSKSLLLLATSQRDTRERHGGDISTGELLLRCVHCAVCLPSWGMGWKVVPTATLRFPSHRLNAALDSRLFSLENIHWFHPLSEVEEVFNPWVSVRGDCFSHRYVKLTLTEVSGMAHNHHPPQAQSLLRKVAIVVCYSHLRNNTWGAL